MNIKKVEYLKKLWNIISKDKTFPFEFSVKDFKHAQEIAAPGEKHKDFRCEWPILARFVLKSEISFIKTSNKAIKAVKGFVGIIPIPEFRPTNAINSFYTKQCDGALAFAASVNGEVSVAINIGNSTILKDFIDFNISKHTTSTSRRYMKEVDIYVLGEEMKIKSVQIEDDALYFDDITKTIIVAEIKSNRSNDEEWEIKQLVYSYIDLKSRLGKEYTIVPIFIHFKNGIYQLIKFNFEIDGKIELSRFEIVKEQYFTIEKHI